MADGDAYREFLEAKVVIAKPAGFEIGEDALSPWLMPHIKKAVPWMLAGGRRALFASFGLAKTSAQLEACWRALKHLEAEDREIFTGPRSSALRDLPTRRGLIVMPLGVKSEFEADAGPDRLNIPVRFVRSTVECWAPGLYLTNYESFRDGRIDLSGFDVVSLDEAACLRGMGGTKTFRVAANQLEHVRFRFVATATPSPNEYVEMLAYAEVLGVMDIGQAKTRFFRRNSEKADQLTLHPHKEREFWLWVASWALFINTPSDVGCSDEGYALPPLEVVWEEIAAPPAWDEAGGESGRQLEMFAASKISVQNQSREKRASMLARVARMADIVAAEPGEHFLLWHDLNDERDLILEAIPEAFVLDGSQDAETKEGRIVGFREGMFPYLAAKPVMAGAGCNFQRWCARAVFGGIGFKFHDFIQAVHRIYRFGQRRPVRIHILYAEAERAVRETLERRWQQHNEQVAKMREIVREYGLSSAAMADVLKRSLGVERVVARGETVLTPSTTSWSPSPAGGGGSSGPGTADWNGDWIDGAAWQIAHNDCVDELPRMAADSVDLIVTSIPFSTQYEYSPNYADFGHTDDNAHFWRQMDFLIPQLLRVLKPGRDACIHVKDRIVPGSLTGLGFQTLQPFGDECRAAFMRHGFAYLGTVTNVTDVVRENNQTYRLGWSEQLKDGTRMGCGVPEQIILLRKPPSDRSDGYADTPVMKHRQDYVDVATGGYAPYDRQAEQEGRIRPLEGSGYSRSRWQQDASAFRRSAGNRLLKPEEWLTFENMDAAFQLWRDFNLDEVYDFEQHVLIGERFDALGKLPAIFQLLPTHSWHAMVWTDVAQMRSLNSDALRKGQEKHLCPLPFDIVNRLIVQRSMPGELVFDPFAGIGTVPYCALKLGRRGAGVELSPDYFASAAKNCALAEAESRPTPTLFDAIEAGCFGEGQLEDAA